MNNPLPQLHPILVAGCFLFQGGCSQNPTVAGWPALSDDEATHLAAKLANDQCERRYKKRPFSPQQHPIVLTNDMYRWGGLEVGASKGFSALVTFRPDGSEPHVEVYFSHDTLEPSNTERAQDK